MIDVQFSRGTLFTVFLRARMPAPIGAIPEMPDSVEVRNRPFLSTLRRGATNAVDTCLGVGTPDVVTIICDEKSMVVASSILDRVEKIGAAVHVFILERHAVRPVDRLPGEIARALRQSTVSIYTAHPQEGEHAHRKEIINLVGAHKLKHAHMIGASEDTMVQGMLSDYRRVAKLNEIVIDLLRKARTIRVTSPKGTDVTVEIDPGEKIFSAAGVIAPGTWENLPSGEVFTCPRNVEGVFICDGLPPTEEQVDRFDLARKPLSMEISGGRLVKVEGGPDSLANRVLSVVRSGSNVDRIGMFAVGTNYDLLMPIGDRIQDQFVPGAYFSLGRPAATSSTSWTSSQQLTFSARKTSLDLDGRLVVENGRYAADILDQTRASKLP